MSDTPIPEDDRASFFEANGGEIINHFGKVICTVNVLALSTTEARSAVRTIIDALEAEYGLRPGEESDD